MVATVLDETNYNLANVEAETLILGGILFDPRAIAKVADILTPDNFYAPAHQKIYRVALSLHRSGQPVDLMLVGARLEDEGLLEQVGGVSYLATLIERTVSAANIDRYAAIVVGHGERRELRSLLLTINELINDRNYSPSELQEKLIEKATALKATVRQRSPVKVAIARIQQVLTKTEGHELEQKIKLEEIRQELKISPALWHNDYVLPAKRELAANKVIAFYPTPSLDILVKLDEIRAQHLKDSEVEVQLRSLASLSGYQLYDLRKLYNERSLEQEFTLDELELATTLPHLLSLHKHSLDIRKVLPPSLSIPLEQTARAMPTAVEAIFTHILPVWATGVGVSSRLVVKASSKYVQPCILRTMVVANSGDRKSPALDNATEALEQMEEEAISQHERECQHYEEELEAWHQRKKDERGPKPVEPVCRRFVTRDVNYEGTIKLHSENPQGLLNKVDELAGYFKRMNKFRNGHGDDDTIDLTLFGGKTYSKDRKGESTYLKRTAVSVTGTIQWEALAELQSKYSDTDYTGALARWLICATELPEPFLDLFSDGEVDFGLTRISRDLLEWLRLLPERDFILSKQAKAVFQKWQHQLVRKMKRETIAALEIAYPKFETYCVRLALLLHLIWAWDSGYLDPAVSGLTMQRAIYVTNWFIGQLRFVLAKNSSSLTLEGNAITLLDLLKKKGELTLRDARRGSRRLRELNDPQLKSVMRSLVEAGLAQYVPSKTLKICQVDTSGTSGTIANGSENGSKINGTEDFEVRTDNKVSTLNDEIKPPPDKELNDLTVTNLNVESILESSKIVSNELSEDLNIAIEFPQDSTIDRESHRDRYDGQSQSPYGIEADSPSIPLDATCGQNSPQSNKDAPSVALPPDDSCVAADVEWLLKFLDDLEMAVAGNCLEFLGDDFLQLIRLSEQKYNTCSVAVERICPNYFQRWFALIDQALALLEQTKSKVGRQRFIVIARWLGIRHWATEVIAAVAVPSLSSEVQLAEGIEHQMTRTGYSNCQLRIHLEKTYNVQSVELLSEQQQQELLEFLKGAPDAKYPELTGVRVRSTITGQLGTIVSIRSDAEGNQIIWLKYDGQSLEIPVLDSSKWQRLDGQPLPEIKLKRIDSQSVANPSPEHNNEKTISTEQPGLLEQLSLFVEGLLGNDGQIGDIMT
ncbi:DUF3987 domain-containing protein [Gloeothece verrucosa]|uniref:DnaB domain protein helicase domain protein n=1 Tax=Gloeothece verrucosa (strain PCC 7822) TaxID=497965 RepID=E0UM31_GLOV7|nr:DUF3987 domain-containing protein [Gloeothece verrucosa]ADN18011.1 DnaB domain protein helicase domain protein [Gloeothece verrucosa PCC 7822]